MPRDKSPDFQGDAVDATAGLSDVSTGLDDHLPTSESQATSSQECFTWCEDCGVRVNNEHDACSCSVSMSTAGTAEVAGTSDVDSAPGLVDAASSVGTNASLAREYHLPSPSEASFRTRASSTVSYDYASTPVLHSARQRKRRLVESSDEDSPPQNALPLYGDMFEEFGPRYDACGINALRFDNTEPCDPNLVTVGGEEGLQSGEEDEEIFAYSSDSSSESEPDVDEDDEEEGDVATETDRIMKSLKPDEVARLLRDDIGTSSKVFNEDELRDMTANGWNVLPDDTVRDATSDGEADKKYDGYCGLSPDIEPHTTSLMDLFFYFLPMAFWRHVASESNRYWRQTLEDRVNKAFRRDQASTSKRKKKTRDQIHAKLLKFNNIQPHEIIRWVGLMIAHVLCPHKRMRSHWATAEVGVLPAGTFGKVMSRERFEEISRFLHFSDNTAEQAKTDRAWKIRPVLATMEKTFKSGYVLGYRVALDEGMLPSRNRHNPTRTYMKDKPHKWGSKCVMTCCATSGYCSR